MAGFKLAEAFVQMSIKGMPAMSAEMRAAKGSFSSAADSLRGSMAGALAGAERGFGGLRSMVAGVRQTMFGVVGAVGGLSTALGGVTGSLARTGVASGNLVTFLSGLRSASSGTRAAFTGLSGSFSGFLAAISGGGSILRALTGSVMGLGRALMATASLPIGAGFQRMFGAARAAVGAFASSGRSALAGFARGSASALGGIRSAMSNALAAVRRGVSGIGSSLLSLLPKLFSVRGALIAIGAAVAGGLGIVKLGADAESIETSFRVMLGSAEKAKALTANVRGMAAETPYGEGELQGATKKMLAFGSTDTGVVQELRMIGDVASGVEAPIGEIAEIYGKARVQGRLFAEDVNQFTGRGIPIIQQLAAQFGVTDSEVKKLVEDGKVGFPQLEKAFQGMTGQGGKFYGMMAARSKDASGMWSTLVDNVKGMFRGIGEAMLPAVKLVMGSLLELTGAGESLEPLKRAIADVSMWFGEKLVASINMAKAAMPYVIAYGSAVAAGLSAGAEMAGELYAGLQRLVSPLTAMLPSIDGIGDAFLRGTEAAKFFYNNWRLYMQLGAEQAKLFGQNAWQQIKTFADNAVTSVKWFGDNWKDVFKTVWDYTKTIVENLGKNLGEFFHAVTQWVQGKGMDFRWTGLEEGFRSSIKELPKLAEAAIRETTPEMDRIAGELGRRWAERSKGGAMDAISGSRPEDRYDLSRAAEGGKASSDDEKKQNGGKFERFSLEGFARALQSRVRPSEEIQNQKEALRKLDKQLEMEQQANQFLATIASNGMPAMLG